MLPVWVTKTVVLLLMTVLTLSACFLPILVRRIAARALRQNSMKIFMSGCLCFGGGVLLATVFLHLLPETRVAFEKAGALGYLPEMPYPLTELSVCMGFFFIYLVEELVHNCLSLGRGHHHHHLPPMQANHSSKPGVKETTVDDASLQKFLPEAESNIGVMQEATGVEAKMATLRAVMVVVALSLHSIMEGLALGLVHTSTDAWVLFAALSAHKLIIAFCMGMELLSIGVSRPAFFISLTIFSIASPLGGLAGTLLVSLIAQTNAVGVLVPTVLHGLSAGTLLYVTFCEILERERAKPENPTAKMTGLLGGFLLMSILQVIDALYAPLEEPFGASHDAASALLATPFPASFTPPSLE